MNFENYTIEELINRDFDCSCGRTHRADIGVIAIGEGAIKRLPEIVASQGTEDGKGLKPGDMVYLTADKNTWGVAGKRVAAILKEEGFRTTAAVLDYDKSHAQMG